jgi:hypothetical protein
LPAIEFKTIEMNSSIERREASDSQRGRETIRRLVRWIGFSRILAASFERLMGVARLAGHAFASGQE